MLSELGFLSILEVHEEQDLSVGELRLPSGETDFLYLSLKLSLAGKLSSEQESQQFQGFDSARYLTPGWFSGAFCEVAIMMTFP